jgi:hypothetical protein
VKRLAYHFGVPFLVGWAFARMISGILVSALMHGSESVPWFGPLQATILATFGFAVWAFIGWKALEALNNIELGTKEKLLFLMVLVGLGGPVYFLVYAATIPAEAAYLLFVVQFVLCFLTVKHRLNGTE